MGKHDGAHPALSGDRVRAESVGQRVKVSLGAGVGEGLDGLVAAGPFGDEVAGEADVGGVPAYRPLTAPRGLKPLLIDLRTDLDLRRDLLTILARASANSRPQAPPAIRRTHRRCAGDPLVALSDRHDDLRQDLLTVLARGGASPRPQPPPATRRAHRRRGSDPLQAVHPHRRIVGRHGRRRGAVVLERPALTVDLRRGPGSGYRLVKAFFDRFDAALLLLVASPLLLAAMIAVRVTSEGPVFFRQERLGQGGNRFTMLKLRTMVRDAEEQLRRRGLYERYVEAGYKLPPSEDCRLTRIGRFLRRTSLDELPQLINVLRGDMSLVGPRPIVPPELCCYGDRANCYLEVRPGLTGLWQITGRSTVTFPERGDIDAEYHARRSLRFDLLILLRTPTVVLRGTGAY